MAAKFTKIETATDITYNPIDGQAIGTYVVKKDANNLDIHFTVPSNLVGQTWQDFTGQLDLLT